MGIIHARVDERLIHGQVAMVWTNTLGANRIMVINDLVAKDSFQINILKMAKPAGVKLSILSVDRAIEKIKTGQYDEEKVFIITRNLEDMAKLAESKVIDSFNIGNISDKGEGIAIKKSVSLTKDQIELINKLLAEKVKITAQMVPNESDESISKIIDKI